jgi:hypothetical protein
MRRLELLLRLVPLVLVLGSAADARAGRWWEGVGGVWTLTYDAQYARSDPSVDVATIGLGTRVDAHSGRSWLGLSAGLDLHLGGARPAAFAYEADLYLLGVSVRLGNWGQIAVTQGIGLSAMATEVGFGGQLPLKLIIEIDLGARVRVLSWARDRYVFGEGSRSNGADLPLVYGDEFDAGVALRWGKRRDRDRARFGGGYFAGVVYQELLGTQFVGGTVGYNLNVGTAR